MRTAILRAPSNLLAHHRAGQISLSLLGRTCLSFGIAVAALVATASPAQADGPVDRVEEDWRVEVALPDADGQAPQIVTVLAPVDSVAGPHCVFELNHATQPNYRAGGMQLQSWTGEQLTESRNFPDCKLLYTPSEVITFTVVMSVENGVLKYEVVNGHSSTWGDFGGQGYLKTSIAVNVDNLDEYNLNTSINNSMVGFASHRVQKFSRTKVRLFSDEEVVGTDTTERVVHLYSE
jgi:hypothetical protein